MIPIATAYYVTMLHISGKRPPCNHSRDWRTPTDVHTRSGQEDAMPNLQDYAFCVIILFLLFAFMLSDIPGPRLISREDAHPMYPRYLRVFSFCHDLLSTHPPISVRKAGGITVVYLCGFWPFAKLN